MTAISSGSKAKPQVLASTRLVRDAFDLMRRSQPVVIYAWLALLAVMLLTQFAASAAGIAITSLQPSALVIAHRIAAVVVGGFASALILRLLSEGGAPGWFRIDRRLIECAGLLAFAQLAVTAVSTVSAVRGLEDGDPMSAAGWSMGAGVAALVFYYVFAKLLLFPLARLEGRDDISIAVAWRLMKRTVRSYVGAWLLIAVPLMAPVYAAYFLLGVNPQEPATAFLTISTVIGTVMTFASQSLALSVYRHRVGETRDVSAVFD